jgi:pimeloyl-ACP methyl ester carboxylesterase
VLGYSVGGWVALRLASESRLAAAAVMAPAVPGGGAASIGYLRKNARVLQISRPERVWAQYVEAARGDHPESYVHQVSPTPLLFVQGLEDRIVPPKSTRRLHELAGRPKELLELRGEDHELENDRAAVVAKVSDWLEARLAAPSPV